MYRISKKVMSRTVDGEEVLLDLTGQVYFGLNSTGTRIWHFLQENRAPRVIAANLSEEFKVSPAQAYCDVMRLIQQLKERDLLADA